MTRGVKKGTVRGKYFRNNNVKERAISLLKFFQKKIETDVFDVELADWWYQGFGNGATLRIDINAQNHEDLPNS